MPCSVSKISREDVKPVQMYITYMIMVVPLITVRYLFIFIIKYIIYMICAKMYFMPMSTFVEFYCDRINRVQ